MNYSRGWKEITAAGEQPYQKEFAPAESPFEIYPKLTVAVALVVAAALFLIINHNW